MELPRPRDAEALLQRASSGGDDAFSEFYDHFAPLVYGLVERIVRDPVTAEAVACDVLVHAWRQSPEFDPTNCSAVSWLLNQAHRQAVEVTRSPSETGTDHKRSPADIDRAELGRLLDGLTGDDRRSVAHAYYGALNYREVASVCHLSPDTVKSSLHHAMARLSESTATTA